MATEARQGAQAGDEATDASAWPPRGVGDRLSFLLKHAQARLLALADPALDPLGIDGREFGVMALFADQGLLSQQQAAQRLGIDRTTMVSLIDGLEARGLVARRPHPDDRRKNVVALTDAGRASLARAAAAIDRAEAEFLAPLVAADAAVLRRALRALVAAAGPPAGPH